MNQGIPGNTVSTRIACCWKTKTGRDNPEGQADSTLDTMENIAGMPSVSFPNNVSWDHLPIRALVSGHLEDSNGIVTMAEGPSEISRMQDITSLRSLET